VDYSTIHRWVLKYAPQFEAVFYRRKRPVWGSWRMDETYIEVKGQWRYLYRAVDKTGQTIDFLLTEQRDRDAALRVLTKAIRRHGVPATITIDGSEANTSAIREYNEAHGTTIAIRQRMRWSRTLMPRYNEAHGTTIAIRQVRYLNNLVEQDHPGVKRIMRPVLGLKSFGAAQQTLVRIELMCMLRKGQLEDGVEQGLTAAEQFYLLAA
jgi:putative transposase